MAKSMWGREYPYVIGGHLISNHELKFLSVSDIHQILEPSRRDMFPSSQQSTTEVQCKLTVGVPVYPSGVG